ncbi:Uncharacterised protein [Mycobacteroides abscessus subsp. abscessus]|nr:Uncharacterised protein [Mycobacteroides abscessus subsp. abscessus]
MTGQPIMIGELILTKLGKSDMPAIRRNGRVLATQSVAMMRAKVIPTPPKLAKGW